MHPLHPARLALAVLGGLLLLVLVFSAVVGQRRLAELYREHFGETRRERLIAAWVSFYLTFASVRILTHAIRAGRGPFHDVSMGGRHIHHLVWGILLLLLVGYGWLNRWGTGVGRTSRTAGLIMACLYGVGAALTLDEFALWLNLQDVYWERQGRASIDAVILFGALLAIGILAGPFLHALRREALKPQMRV